MDVTVSLVTYIFSLALKTVCSQGGRGKESYLFSLHKEEARILFCTTAHTLSLLLINEPSYFIYM